MQLSDYVIGSLMTVLMFFPLVAHWWVNRKR